VTALAALNWRERNRFSGIIGWGLRRSWKMKAIRPRMPARAAITIDADHPWSGPWISA